MGKKILICGLILLLAVIMMIVTFYNFILQSNKNLSNEAKRAMTYNEITDDAKVDGDDYVQFSSFFIRDLDGDGYVEKYDGTCNEISESATLYFDINILTKGVLKNGKITINGKNFNLQTNLHKDEVLKNDYISDNTTSIELNDINYGTQKSFYGKVLADIGSNINNYSRSDNTIVLSGTWESTDGTQSVDINKTLNLTVDWYIDILSTSSDSTDARINMTLTNNYVETISESRAEEEELDIKYSTKITGPGHSNIYDMKAIDGDEGYITAGSFAGDCDVDNDGVVDITSVGDFDILVTKFDSDGEVEWYYNSGSTRADEANAVSVCPDGSGYIVAGYESTVDERDGVIIKLNTSGNEVWKKYLSGDITDIINGVKVLSTGDIVVVGKSDSTNLNLGGGDLLASQGFSDGFVACYDNAGTYKWSFTVQGTDESTVTDVTETTQGIAVSVDFLGSVSVNGTTVASTGNQDSMVIALGLDGNYQWHQIIAGSEDESIISLTTDTEGNVVAVGGFASNVTVGAGTITPQTTDYSNALMIRLASVNGEYVSNYTFGGTSDDEKLTSATLTSDGGLLLGGWFYSESFDVNGDGTNDITSVSGCNDGIVVKLNDLGEVDWHRTFTGRTYDPVYSVAESSDNKYMVAGNSDSTSLSSNGTSLLEVQSYADSYIINIATKAQVIVEYIDKTTGEPIAPEEIIEGYVGDPYKTEEKEFEGYELVEAPENAEGTMTKEPIKVTYIYGKPAEVIVNYIDKDTKEKLIDEEIIKGYVGDEYKTEAKEINGYDLVEEEYPNNAEGTMTEEEIRVDYYYVKKAQVIVEYIDKTTGEPIAPEEIIEGYEGDSYKTEEKEFEGYELVEKPENAEGTMIKEPIKVTYVYIREIEVIVSHVDKDTNEKLVDEEVIKGYEGDEYTTEEKEIPYYNLVEKPENAEGIMKVEIIEDVVNNKTYVTYYYQKKTFNLKIDKTILSIIQNGQEKLIYGDLAKAEIYRKNIDSDGLQVIYSIKVTNNGELAGKATILESIPAGMIMNPSYNPNWNITGSTATLETREIKPGETVEYRVALDWANGGNNVGSKENTAEIIGSSNEAGFEEKDGSDNRDNAILVITVSTGAPTYVAIAGGMLIILAGIAVSIIYKKKK